MKTRERSAAAGGRTGAPTQQPGDRLPFAPRERKPALAALAVLLILIGALGTTVLVLRAGDEVAGIKITKSIAAGQAIPPSAMEQVMVPEASEFSFTPWSQRNQLADYRATGDIPANSPLVGEMLTKGEGIEAGKAVVGLSLDSGQFPGKLKPGNTVAAYRVGDQASQQAEEGEGSSEPSSSSNLLVQSAKVQTADAIDGGSLGGTGGYTVTLLVDQDEAGPLSEAASDQEVALVLVAGNN